MTKLYQRMLSHYKINILVCISTPYETVRLFRRFGIASYSIFRGSEFSSGEYFALKLKVARFSKTSEGTITVQSAKRHTTIMWTTAFVKT